MRILLYKLSKPPMRHKMFIHMCRCYTCCIFLEDHAAKDSGGRCLEPSMPYI